MGSLRRAKRDRWIMGVCGGIAHRYGYSSIAVRLAAIVLAVIIPGFCVIPKYPFENASVGRGQNLLKAA